MITFKDNKTKRILEELQHNARTAKEIFESMFPHDPDTFKVTKRLLGYMTPQRKLTNQELERLEQKRFYKLMSKLRREGLVNKRGFGLGAVWQSTAKGVQKLLRKNLWQK